MARFLDPGDQKVKGNPDGRSKAKPVLGKIFRSGKRLEIFSP
jgi:hypothetical protein